MLEMAPGEGGRGLGEARRGLVECERASVGPVCVWRVKAQAGQRDIY